MSKQNDNHKKKSDADKKAQIKAAAEKKAPYKKERKKHYTKEDYRQKKRLYTIGAIFCLLAGVLAISVKIDGKMTWEAMQVWIYASLGISGLFLKNGAQYEENAALAKVIDIVGLIFVALCLGMIITLVSN